MRYIKFRGWEIGLNNMWTWEDIKSAMEITDVFDDGGWCLMQYTGLKDKNGVEIYEGDVVKVSPDKGKHWDKGSIGYGNYASFIVNLPKIGTGIKSPLLNFCIGTMGISGATIYIEVIGNIYENPELLTKE